ncbi:MAG: tetratricopeptide repeat-containing sensor histidine kinase [Flavobacteriales bacterium]
MYKHIYILLSILFLQPLFAQEACIERLLPNQLSKEDTVQHLILQGLQIENRSESIAFFEQAIQLFQPKDSVYKGILPIYLAKRYVDIEKFEFAIRHLKTSENYAKRNCPKLLKHCYSLKSRIYWLQENYDEAIKYRLKNKAVSETFQDSLIADANLLSIYHDLKDTFYVKSLLSDFNEILSNQNKTVHPIVQLTFKQIEVHYLNSLEEKQKCIAKMHSLSEGFNAKFKIQVQMAEGELYKDLEPDRAINIFEKVLEEINTSGLIGFKHLVLMQLTELYFEKKDFSKANEYLVQIDQNNISDWKLGDFYILSFDINSGLNQHKTALKFAKLILNYNDSMHLINQNMEYTKWSKAYELEKKEQELALNAKNIEFQNLVNFTLVMVMVFILLGLFLLFIQFRKNKKNSLLIESQNAKISLKNVALESANKTKEQLFAMVSHDLLSPYNALYLQTKGISKQDQLHNNNPELIKLLNRIEMGITQNYVFVKDMLIWAKANSDKIQPKTSSFSVSELIDRVLEPYVLIIDDKSIHIHVQKEKDLIIQSDFNLLSVVLSNLLSNALKHTEKQGEIVFNWHTNNNQTIINIEDSGSGLTEEEIKFLQSEVAITQLSTNENGLGLSICRDILALLGGVLIINSTFGKGTQVQIVLNKY